MAIRVYGISGKTPPNANQRADFEDLLIAVSMVATLTKPSRTDPTKLITAATKNAINASKAPKRV